MVFVIIGMNLLIAIAGFYAAWRIWKIRRVLAGVADALTSYERTTDRGLSVSPPAILKAQRGTRSLRQQYRRLEGQIQKTQQILALLLYLQSLIPFARQTVRSQAGKRQNSTKACQRKYLRAQQERPEID
ncbi:MAG: hypothetical protein SFW36_00160 [Leptolyngbyaceae cyanobacterium bins.59]|nr:hypothetical protein [Leptolyngbyaceae cyanobacterium bins.59]